MEELLQNLEKRIKQLIDQHVSLKDSHQQLHQGQSQLARENETLQASQQRAIFQIETLVSRLKAIEK